MACHALNKRTIVIIMTKDYDEIDVNMNKIDNVYQISFEINNFDFIITVIDVSHLIPYQMKKLAGDTYLFIVIYGRMQQIVGYSFMLSCESNTFISFKCRTNIITVQVD